MTYKDKKNGRTKQQFLAQKEEREYEKFINDNEFARKLIDKNLSQHPEILPNGVMKDGYKLKQKR